MAYLIRLNFRTRFARPIPGSATEAQPASPTLEDLRTAVAAGDAPMTTDLLLQLVDSTMPFIGSGGGDAHEWLDWHDAWIASWAALATPHWLDLLLALADQPADWWTEHSWGRGDCWYGSLYSWLIAFSEQDPEISLDRLDATLAIAPPAMQCALIGTIGSLGLRRGLSALEPLLIAEQLRPEVVDSIATVLADLGGPDAHQLLTRLVAEVDSGRKCHGPPHLVLQAREMARDQLAGCSRE